jgi:peptidoglycan/xylan/chitin deacetylase (PgdA/CDA1 family)
MTRRGSSRRSALLLRAGGGFVVLAAVAALVVVVLTISGPGGGGALAGATATTAALRPVARHARRSRADAQRAAEDAAIDRVLARTPYVVSGGGRRREIALTFDDGPGPYTPRVLDVLERLHVAATFFTVGFMIPLFRPSLRRELRIGAAIGDHTEQHPMMTQLSPARQLQQIDVQTQQLRVQGGRYPRLYRPPYGAFDHATLRILRRKHMLMALWSVDTEDYQQPGVKAIVHNALAGAKPGAIILMHDAGGTRSQTIAALPRIVRGLRARGYRLVTVPRLMRDDPPRHVPRERPRLAGG